MSQIDSAYTDDPRCPQCGAMPVIIDTPYGEEDAHECPVAEERAREYFYSQEEED